MNHAAVIGWPIEHSRSPLIHRSWLAEHRLAGTYERIAVAPADLPAFIASFQDRGLSGFNVTLPHKIEVCRLCDEPDETARLIGAANLVWRDGRHVRCTNTDGLGFMAHLDQSAPGWSGGSAHIFILGAGGAARSLMHAFIVTGVERITLANRTQSAAAALVGDFRDLAGRRGIHIDVRPWSERTATVREASVIVNTTSVGMKGAGSLGLELVAARPGTVVADIVYVPLETGLLAEARRHGLRVVDGLGMLLHQAVPAFEIFYGVRPRVTEELRARLVADIEGR